MTSPKRKSNEITLTAKIIFKVTIVLETKGYEEKINCVIFTDLKEAALVMKLTLRAEQLKHELTV